MAQLPIPYGAAPNDGTGIPNRTAWQRTQDNFTDLYALQSQTVNAGDVRFQGGATTEARIQLAIDQAVTELASMVFVPAVMLPYDASLVTFQAAVKMTREGGDSSVYDVLAYGAAGDGVIDDTAAVQAAISGAQAFAGLVYLPSGTFVVSAPLQVSALCHIRGSGEVISIFKGTSALGTDALLTVDSGVTIRGSVISSLSIDNTAAPNATGLLLSNTNRVKLRDFHVGYGAIGLSIDTSSSLYIAGARFTDQTTAGIRDFGDGGEEHFFENIHITVSDAAITLATAFELVRTTATDTGALYFDNFRVTRGSGAYTTGIWLNCSAANTISPVFISQCVVDGCTGNALKSDNCTTVIASGSWLVPSGASTDYTIYINGGNSHQYTGNYLYGATGGCVEFANAPDQLVFTGNRFVNGTAFNLPASLPPTNLYIGVNNFVGVSAMANDMTRLALALGVTLNRNLVGGLTVLTAGVGGGLNHCFALTEPTGKMRAFRVSSGSTLALLNNAGTLNSFTFGDGGALTGLGDLDFIGGFRQTIDGWAQTDVAANQTNVELTRADGRFAAPRAGSVTAVTVRSTEARTAGTLTVTVFKNTGLAGAAGSTIGLTAVLDGTNTSKKATTQAKDTDTFAANDEIYAVVTTDGSWTPTTADIRVAIEIET